MIRYELILFVILFSGNLSAQKNYLKEKTLAAYSEYLSKEFGIACKIPVEFANLNKYNVMWKVRKEKDKHSGSMFGLTILSNNKECMVMYSAFPHHVSKEDAEERKKMALPVFPRSQITFEIKTALGLYYSYEHPLNNDSAKFDFNDYVTIVAGKAAREKFNADSIYIYDIPGADSVYFFDETLEKVRMRKYPYCTSMFISRNDRAAMDFRFFFTPKGKKKEDQYINMLNKHIWYEDDFKMTKNSSLGILKMNAE